MAVARGEYVMLRRTATVKLAPATCPQLLYSLQRSDQRSPLCTQSTSTDQSSKVGRHVVSSFLAVSSVGGRYLGRV